MQSNTDDVNIKWFNPLKDYVAVSYNDKCTSNP